MTASREQTLEKFKEYLLSAVDSKWADDDVKKSHQRTLDLLNKVDLENHSESYDIYVGTMQYFATGEGITDRVIVGLADDEGSFLVDVAEKIDPYFAMGVDVYKGIPTDDKVFDRLVSPHVRSFIQQEIDANNEGGGGNIVINLYCHSNYS